MSRKSVGLLLTLLWGVCFSNISHATIIEFETEVIVDVVNADLGFVVGDVLQDELIVDFSAGSRITDIANIVSFLGDGGLVLTPLEVDLELLGDGTLMGFLVGLILGTDIHTRDDWVNGTGRLVVTDGLDGPVLLEGSTIIGRVPEPTSLALLSLGLFGLGMVRRRSRQ